jgi:FkbM family methyltransferase
MFLDEPVVEVHRVALSDHPHKGQLYYPWVGAGGASLSPGVNTIQTPIYEQRSEDVDIITIDQFCAQRGIPKVDFIKIDVEGFEWRVIFGAQKMIQTGTIRFIAFEMGSASIATKTFLFDIVQTTAEYYDLFLVLNRGVVKVDYWYDLESFYGASNFILRNKLEAERTETAQYYGARRG